MMDLAVKYLNVTALREWKHIMLDMDLWMQAVVIGAFVFLLGASLLSWLWGLKMNRSARFAVGITSVFHMVLILCVREYSVDLTKAFIIAAIAGVAAGFLYAFLERGFQFAAGFVLGTVLGKWLVPQCFHMGLNTQPGRIWRLVIAVAAGILFALLAKKLRFLLTAIEGGVVLGLLCDTFLAVTEIPWVTDKLSDAQILNLFPIVLAGVGILIQFFQWIGMIREQRSLRIPAGEERDYTGDQSSDQDKSADENTAGEGETSAQDEDAISMAEAEEVLVEKAKELAVAATRSAQNARLKERYEDVAEGLYTSKIAADRLGITEEAFLEGMKKSGYQVPGEDGEAPADSAADAPAESMDETTKAVSENTSEESPDISTDVAVDSTDVSTDSTDTGADSADTAADPTDTVEDLTDTAADPADTAEGSTDTAADPTDTAAESTETSETAEGSETKS